MYIKGRIIVFGLSNLRQTFIEGEEDNVGHLQVGGGIK